MRRLLAALAVILMPLAAEAGERLALFPLEFVNTSLEPTRPDETARLALVADLARERFAAAGLEIVGTGPVQAELAGIAPLRGCNGCELGLGQKLGAAFAALGWVQKVSNLILNINLQVRDVATGRLVAAGSVDIRGNTDESWRRGMRYLLDRSILPPSPPG
jgi:hypothetical protein